MLSRERVANAYVGLPLDLIENRQHLLTCGDRLENINNPVTIVCRACGHRGADVRPDFKTAERQTYLSR